MLLGLFQDPLAVIAFLIALVVGITVHEFAHAWVAQILGDPTAKYAGRVTLNPLAHLDPLGTILLFVAGFGWGKPVPVNPQYFARPVIDEFLVALAGPASNFVVAALIGLSLQVVPVSGTFVAILVAVMQINLTLMLFNLLPVPPLDGSKVLQLVIGEDAYRTVQGLSLPLILALLFALQATGLGTWLSETVVSLTRFLLGA